MANRDSMDCDSSGPRSVHAQDLRDQGVVLLHVFSVHPTQMRLPELVGELTNESGDFAERDGIDRAVRDLVSVGLLFKSGALVLPTRAALRFHEILEDSEVGLS
jgi:hypothetical protein